MTNDDRKLLAHEPIKWDGDLADDCTAVWAGLMLRAEWMNDNDWWWAVYDMQKRGIVEEVVDASYEHDIIFQTGEEARRMAENIARAYLRSIVE